MRCRAGNNSGSRSHGHCSSPHRSCSPTSRPAPSTVRRAIGCGLTVFAPTDAAFAKLPKGTVETLLKPENKKALVEILTYHVVPGKLEATDPVHVDGVPLRIVHTPGKGHLTSFGLDVGAKSLRWFVNYYGIPYPDAKIDMVALPDFKQRLAASAVTLGRDS